MRKMMVAGLTAMAAMAMFTACARAEQVGILQATLAETNQKTGEVSTEELRRILADGTAIVLDTRARAEFEAGHIPGARHIDAPAGERIAAVERIVNGDKTAALVLYCNGPFCQASRRFADELVAARFTNVRRYQLGIPVWRALGGPTEIELPGITRIYGVDRTAVMIDVRGPEEFSMGTIPGARNLRTDNLDATIKQMMSGQLHDAPLPLDDFNRRIVLIGRDASQARKMAEAMSTRPWHNVAFFSGSVEMLTSRLGSTRAADQK
jgi:rhodanese-related sulfurtransferase